MNELKLVEPEYKSWSLEKLQHEYFSTNLRRITAEMEITDLKQKMVAVNEFMEAFDALMAERDKEL